MTAIWGIIPEAWAAQWPETYTPLAEETAARLAKMKRRKRAADSDSKRIGKRRTNG